jgi:hypothetical protein
VPHAHWHIYVSCLNLSGTFFYLCSLLDGYRRYIVHHEIREQMTEQDVEIFVQRSLEAFPDAKPRIISDSGPQFVAKDFKAFIRIKGMDHADLALLSAEKRQTGVLAQEPEIRVHASGETAEHRRGQVPGIGLNGRLQPAPIAQRHWRCHACRQTGWKGAGNFSDS